MSVCHFLLPCLCDILQNKQFLLHTRSEEREVLGAGSIPVAILPSCQNKKFIALQLNNMNIVG